MGEITSRENSFLFFFGSNFAIWKRAHEKEVVFHKGVTHSEVMLDLCVLSIRAGGAALLLGGRRLNSKQRDQRPRCKRVTKLKESVHGWHTRVKACGDVLFSRARSLSYGETTDYSPRRRCIETWRVLVTCFLCIAVIWNICQSMSLREKHLWVRNEWISSSGYVHLFLQTSFGCSEFIVTPTESSILIYANRWILPPKEMWVPPKEG